MKPSLWSHFFYGLPVGKIFREISEAGFAYCELDMDALVKEDKAGFSPEKAARIKEYAAACGITLGQVHSPMATLREDTDLPDGMIDFAAADAEQLEYDLAANEKLLDLCGAMGIAVMVVHPGGCCGWSDEDEYRRIRDVNAGALERLAKAARRMGVKIAIENMGANRGRKCFGTDFEDILKVIEDVGSDCLGVCLDTSHANYTGKDIPAAIRLCGKRLIATHISDNLGRNDDHLFPYSGTIAWQPVISALREIGYDGLFNLEIPGENRRPLEVLRLKARYARRLTKLMLGE